jgi:hypothetical protein
VTASATTLAKCQRSKPHAGINPDALLMAKYLNGPPTQYPTSAELATRRLPQ